MAGHFQSCLSAARRRAKGEHLQLAQMARGPHEDMAGVQACKSCQSHLLRRAQALVSPRPGSLRRCTSPLRHPRWPSRQASRCPSDLVGNVRVLYLQAIRLSSADRQAYDEVLTQTGSTLVSNFQHPRVTLKLHPSSLNGRNPPEVHPLCTLRSNGLSHHARPRGGQAPSVISIQYPA